MALKAKLRASLSSDWIVFIVLLAQLANPILLMVLHEQGYKIAISSFSALALLFFMVYIRLTIEIRQLRTEVLRCVQTPPIIKLAINGEELTELPPQRHDGVRH